MITFISLYHLKGSALFTEKGGGGLQNAGWGKSSFTPSKKSVCVWGGGGGGERGRKGGGAKVSGSKKEIILNVGHIRFSHTEGARGALSFLPLRVVMESFTLS